MHGWSFPVESKFVPGQLVSKLLGVTFHDEDDEGGAATHDETDFEEVAELDDKSGYDECEEADLHQDSDVEGTLSDEADPEQDFADVEAYEDWFRNWTRKECPDFARQKATESLQRSSSGSSMTMPLQRSSGSSMNTTPAEQDKHQPICQRFIYKPPSEILFSQDHIGQKFRSGMTLCQTLSGLALGIARKRSVTIMRVVLHEGRYYTLDNRRLAVYRLLEQLGRTRIVKAVLLPKPAEEWERKFTTVTQGTQVVVRPTKYTIGRDAASTTYPFHRELFGRSKSHAEANRRGSPIVTKRSRPEHIEHRAPTDQGRWQLKRPREVEVRRPLLKLRSSVSKKPAQEGSTVVTTTLPGAPTTSRNIGEPGVATTTLPGGPTTSRRLREHGVLP
eukprot:TRINITY_DN18806_c0_g1_i1.p1 TRINITY_DN18806_c0_g1~~TRINITY_DN18806_c0_g1_i1.p1  ORF type:complete len:390 (+),score=30.05 TRINITY_DN18806_c0_g1_i1:238-1407(+)